MGHLRQLVAAFLLMAFLGTPAAACLVVVASMTPDEEQCCREMAGDCGSVPMPAAHSCCPAVPRDGAMTAALKVVKVAPALVVTGQPEIALATPDHALQRLPDDSPPEPPPGADSILRI